MDKGNWTPIDKSVVFLLPKKRAYTTIEALISVSTDLDNIVFKSRKKPATPEEAIKLLRSQISISAYSSLWGWSRTKTRKFINDLSSDSGHLADRKGTGRGHHIRLVLNRIQMETNKDGTGRGQEEDTFNNPLSFDPVNQKEHKGILPQAEKSLPVSFQEYCKANAVPLENKRAIEFYLVTYRKYRKEEHPRLRPEQWQEAVECILYALEDEIDLESARIMIVKHFQTQYKAGCDYRIMHYISKEGVIKDNRFYEECY